VLQRRFPSGRALNVDQYAHTAWNVRDGLSERYIPAIAQMISEASI
jgi:hypothetical protein